MAIPTYDALYPSLLKSLADQKIHTNREIADFIASDMGISQRDRQEEVLSSGKPVFKDRVSWACTYLKMAGLIESPRRGHFRLSAEGLAVLQDLPQPFTNSFLLRYPSFRAFKHRSRADAASPSAHTPGDSAAPADETPQALIEQSIASLNQRLAGELLDEIMAKDSSFFESLVIQLLLKMGYGGSASDSGFVTQRSNDGGIDGIIREDKLGFDQIYIQAKRWDPGSSVSRPEIQKFSGALQDEGAAKGLFITTAHFSDGARASAEKQHIVLIDGERLTRLMIEYNVGVSTVAQYEVKTIDSDFFNEEAE